MFPELKSKNVPGFHLLRRFSLLSLVSIATVCVVLSYLMSQFLREHMLRDYASTMREFVQSVADIEIADARAKGDAAVAIDGALKALHRHLLALPNTLRTNIYGTDSRMIWSSEAALKGQTLGKNPELESALKGAVEIETGVTGREQHPKNEHVFLDDRAVPFVEIYLPIRDPGKGNVIAVAEIYRIPTALFNAIERGVRLVWITGAVAGLFLFGALFWIVKRAQDTIRRQQDQLIESETLAAVGEMGSAVAHGIRNPLASIRSSAELWHDEATGAAREASGDIVNEVDKLEKWVRDLLTYSQPDHVESGRVRLAQLVERVTKRFEREFEKRSIAVSLELAQDLPLVSGDEVLLEQALANLVTNAMEAMPGGGRLAFVAVNQAALKRVVLEVVDSGIGIAPGAQERVFAPFHTTKAKGLGLGLSLVRRIVRRFGGDVTITSALGEGTHVILQLVAITKD